MELATLQDYFHKLGIESDAAALYVELTRFGHSSALRLSKASGISRTQVYRQLERLQQYGLVNAEQLSYGTLYRALPLDNIESVLADREAETATLRESLAGMTQALQTIAGNGGPKATVQHFYGLAGLKQANWNLTKADKEFRVFEAAHISQHLDKAFARHCRERYIEKQLTSFDLTNATSITAAELEPYEPARTFYRYIDPAVLNIMFEVYIYNDVVTLLDYTEGHQMALEVHHPTLTTMMWQLYESVWAAANPLEINAKQVI